MSSAADQFADRLDQVLPPHSQIVPDQTGDPLVDTALRLARGPHPALTSDQVARMQNRVLNRAVSHRPRRRIILQWAAAACLIIALVTTGTARVSAGSLPGEPFYSVKRLVERGQLALSSDTGEVDLRLKFANRRLDEFERLLERGEINLDPLEDAVEEMHSALALVEKGSGEREPSVQQLMKLSSRQVQLAEQAGNRIAQDAATAGELHNAAAEAEQVAEEARDLLEQPASLAPGPSFAAGESAVTIPADMVEQASSPQQLFALAEPLEPPAAVHRDEAAKSPVETQTLPPANNEIPFNGEPPALTPAASPVFASLPPVRETSAPVLTETPPTSDNTPTGESPAETETPTENIEVTEPPLELVVETEMPPTGSDDLDMASLPTAEPTSGDPVMTSPTETPPTVTIIPPTETAPPVETDPPFMETPTPDPVIDVPPLPAETDPPADAAPTTDALPAANPAETTIPVDPPTDNPPTEPAPIETPIPTESAP